jgi:hypothetical protein
MEEGDDFVDSLYSEIIELGFEAPSVDMLVEMASCGEYLYVAEILQDLINEDHSDWASEICKRIATREGEAEPDHATVAILLGTIVQTSGDAVAAKLVRRLTAPKKQQGAYTYDFVAAVLVRMVAMRQTQWAAQLVWALLQEVAGGSPFQDLVPRVLEQMAAAGKAQQAADLCCHIVAGDGTEECRALYDIGWALARMAELGAGERAAAVAARVTAAPVAHGGVAAATLLEAVGSATDAATAAGFGKQLEAARGGGGGAAGAGEAAAALEGLSLKQ